MVKPLTLIFLFFISGFSAQAKMPKVVLDHKKIKRDELAVFQEGKYEFIKMKDFEKVRYSANCFAGGKTRPQCDAFKSLNKPEAQIVPKFEGNPAAQLCTQIGGANLIGISKERKEYNVCYFPDKSYGVSWSMFYKINPKSVIK